MSETSLNPWDQQPGESAPGFAAFAMYRDMGAERSIDAVARQLGGHQEGTRPAQERAVERNWATRARAWDSRTQAVRQQAVERVATTSSEEWARRRDRQYTREYEISQRLLNQAEAFAVMPVLEQTMNTECRLVAVSPIEPSHLRAAAAVTDTRTH